MKLDCAEGAGCRAWVRLFNTMYGMHSSNYVNRIDEELEKFNGINERGSAFVIFATDEDALAFILTWG